MKKIILAVAVLVGICLPRVMAQSAVNIANETAYSSQYQLNTATFGVTASSAVVKTGTTFIKAIEVLHTSNVTGQKVAIYDSATAIGALSPKVEIDVDAKGVYPLNFKCSTGLFWLNTSTAGVILIYK